MPMWTHTRIHVWFAAGFVGAISFASGCSSSHEQMICDGDGCQICDAYGCRPADPSIGQGGTSGAGGAAGAAGGSSCDPATTACPCGPGDACEGELTCIDGLCLTPCSFSSECGGGRICLNGKCVVGCDVTVPCPGGYSCNAKGVCEVDPTDPQCGDSEPCAGGLQCVGGVCQGGCVTNDDCAPGELCSAATGTCIEDPQPTKPCEKDATVCSPQQVCADGYCRYPCASSEACKLVDARIPECKAGICMSEAEANPQCTEQIDCAQGQDCVSNVCL